jgi:hypothetical protein
MQKLSIVVLACNSIHVGRLSRKISVQAGLGKNLKTLPEI